MVTNLILAPIVKEYQTRFRSMRGGWRWRREGCLELRARSRREDFGDDDGGIIIVAVGDDPLIVILQTIPNPLIFVADIRGAL